MTYRFLRRREVEQIVGLSRSTLYVMISEGRFPKPIRIGNRAVAWSEQAIHNWMQARTDLGEADDD